MSQGTSAQHNVTLKEEDPISITSGEEREVDNSTTEEVAGEPKGQTKPSSTSSTSVNPEPTKSDSEAEAKPTVEKTYNWCKCFCDPAEHGTDHYYMHFVTYETRWEEPDEPYWVWDAVTESVHSSGLQQSSKQKAVEASETDAQTPKTEPKAEYTGYNPRIHGKYDPTAPYAEYHRKKRAEEEAAANAAAASRYPTFAQPSGIDYGASAAFNSATGAFQSADKSADRHNDFNKSKRQLNAYFDVDAAANAHDGRSLKAERQAQKFSKQEIQEMAAKRREKKEKKRMDFYRS